MSRQFKQVVLVAAFLGVTVLGLAACGSSSSSSSSSPNSPSSGAGASTASTDPAATSSGLRAAEAYLARFTSNPTSIGLTTPLPAKPAAGKTIIDLETPEPVAVRQSQALAAAAKVLGWNYSVIPAGATSSSATSAFQAALAKHPNGIVFGGYPAPLFAAEIKQAQAQGVAIISNATGDGPVPGVLADLDGQSQEAQYGRIMAAYFVANSGGTGSAVVYTITGLPILTDFVNSFQAALGQWCPKCSVQNQSQEITSIGTTTPSAVTTFLQSHPAIKWVIMSNGDLAQGVSAAVRTAGLSGIKIAGEVPTAADLTNLKAGSETAWVGFPVDILSWRIMDAFARHFENASLTNVLAVPLPAQTITAGNLSSVVLGTQSYYVGVKGYEQQFESLWHVG